MLNGDKIYPMLLNHQHVVSYRDLRRIHGDAGATIWARAAAEGATLPNDYLRWGWYSRYYDEHASN